MKFSELPIIFQCSEKFVNFRSGEVFVTPFASPETPDSPFCLDWLAALRLMKARLFQRNALLIFRPRSCASLMEAPSAGLEFLSPEPLLVKYVRRSASTRNWCFNPASSVEDCDSALEEFRESPREARGNALANSIVEGVRKALAGVFVGQLGAGSSESPERGSPESVAEEVGDVRELEWNGANDSPEKLGKPIAALDEKIAISPD